MEIKTNVNKELFVLKAIFEEKGGNDQSLIIKKQFVISEDFSKKEAFIFLGKKSEFDKNILKTAVKKIICSVRDYQIDVQTFIANSVNEKDVVENFLYIYKYEKFDLWTLRKKEENTKNNFDLINVKEKHDIEKINSISEAINYARNFQIQPANILNSEIYAEQIKKDFAQFSNLKVAVLDKKEIEKHKMGLLLSVNKASVFEPRLVSIEYNGNPDSEEKIALIGKGIIFDSGGTNLKPSGFISDMKFDMSGSAIVASVLKSIAQLKPKVNVVAIMPITDNRLSEAGSLPDDVYISMNGKSVEINNTDAEGRLVLADGMTYAIRNLKANKVVTVATLTGAITIALGKTYVGTWATNDKDWEKIQVASIKAEERVWRMPLHSDYAEYIRKSLVADLKNTDLTRNAGSCSAAMFLKEFSEDKDFMHFDIAATAEDKGVPTGVMTKTLINMLLD